MVDVAVFHRGKDGGLWYNIKRDGVWDGDAEVPGVGISAAPAAIVQQGAITVFHQGASDNGGLFYTQPVEVLGQQTKWLDMRVANTGMSDNPSAVFYRGLIHVFHQGYKNNKKLWENRGSVGSWLGDYEIPDASSMSYGPSAVEYQGKLYVFFQGCRDGEGSAVLHCCLFDPVRNRWQNAEQAPFTSMAAGPCAIEFNGNIYVLYQGPDGALCYNVFNGRGWDGNKRACAADGSFIGLSDSPTAVDRGDGTLAVFHQGYGDNEDLWETSFDGTNWTSDKPVPNTRLSFGPSAVLWPGISRGVWDVVTKAVG
jgi:hypothetical protein